MKLLLMKPLRRILPFLLLAQTALAQPVPRTTLVEHFTNTWCSICAGRNPAFYTNLAAFPDVLHLAYYPSAPYAGCPFNQLNKAENDARTNFYGVYGSTPRLVINGSALAANEDYSSPVIFQREAGKTSDYALGVTLNRRSADSGEAVITVRKVAANGLTTLRLFAVVAEDTIMFNAKNGETIHYDRFNKSLTGTAPQSLSAPALVGDSLLLRYTFAVSGSWGPTRVTAILQDTARQGLQAARSAQLPRSLSIPGETIHTPFLFPNPASKELFVSGLLPGYYHYTITNLLGQRAMNGVVSIGTPILLQSLPSGNYVLSILDGSVIIRRMFTKE